MQNAIEAMRRGAYDYITKPYEPEDILSAVNRVISKQRLQKELEFLRKEVEETRGFDQIISQNHSMLEIFELVKKLAYTTTNLMITGESGTGKELIARSIHRQGNRKKRPFVAVNCAAIPSELMEVRCSATRKEHLQGALPDHQQIQAAPTEELSSSMRSALRSTFRQNYRVLQEREIERIGSNRPIKVDIRVIAAANTTLKI
jgi:DNA-binding NtrC family response regulator